MKNFNLIKFKMADLRQILINKFSRQRDSLTGNIFLCLAPKFLPYIYFPNSSDEFEIGQDSDRN